MLPYFIAAYKAGSTDVDLPGEDTAVAWYRTTPIDAGSDGGKTFPTLIILWTGKAKQDKTPNGARAVASLQFEAPETSSPSWR
jgi:hypothetical protein